MRELLSLRTVRRKIMLMTKAAGILLILSYILLLRLPVREELSLPLWTAFIIVLTLAVDFLLAHYITKPVTKLCKQAQKIANLDFSSACEVTAKDEFGSLAESLKQMSEKLQRALCKLETANMQLEKEVKQERQLLNERRDIVEQLSHEMKTPLGVIRAYAEGLQDAADEETKQNYAEVIIAETECMSRLVSSLLELSALENGAVCLAPERFDFVELFETEAGRLLIDVPDAHFTLEYELPEQKVYVYADRVRIEQVLDNLLVNAKKNVTENGVLRLSLVLQNGILNVRIYNQGNPIPPELLPKIWDKFCRGTNAAYRGTGLGLAIAAQVLSMHGFDYGAENCTEGVLFFFSMPVC
ncbi:MAG: cell wall metabolism sensor histidine kinase WalK [Lachnospiraceae bacterium]|jgi:signal transduction histidine kinase|nr:cell wall metabolism sensor histidine kinase WalK [Lachnospiraceae bacterium]